MSAPINTEQFTQLKMFMSPAELKSLPSVDATRYPPGSDGHREMWDEKLYEAGPAEDKYSLIDSVRRQGVRTPVIVWHNAQEGASAGEFRGMVHGNGHHRVASADYLGHEVVPVLHEDRGWMSPHANWTPRYPEGSAPDGQPLAVSRPHPRKIGAATEAAFERLKEVL